MREPFRAEQLRWSGFRSYVPRRRHARTHHRRLRGRPILLQFRASATVFGGDLPFQLTRQTKYSIRQIGSPGRWQSDPLIHDDQVVVFNVRDKGLVVITGCGHAGAINSIRYAQKLSGVDKVYALIGGLHLTGAVFEPIIAPTLKELKAIAPRLVMPGHCTGWKATHAFAREFPEAFVQPSVGTRLVLESTSQ
jgi:metal-dependent hydrolase (beta-lactamase superfamily II)